MQYENKNVADGYNTANDYNKKPPDQYFKLYGCWAFSKHLLTLIR